MNNKKNIALLVVSCDNYSDVWEVFFKTFRKFWPDCPYKVYLGSNFKKCIEPDVVSITIGEDLSYSENLIKMISNIDADYILMWVDDLMLSGPMDTNRMVSAINYAVANEIDFLKLLPNYPLSYKEESHGVGRLPQGIRYRITIGVSLVKKEFLRSIASGRKSAWELEYGCSTIVERTGGEIYALVFDSGNHVFKYINVLGRGKVIRNAAAFLMQNGGESILTKRGKQPIAKYIYYKLYLVMLIFLMKLKIYWR